MGARERAPAHLGSCNLKKCSTAGLTWPAVLYDNHHPKGHHRHLGGKEEAYGFVDVGRLVDDFLTDVRNIAGQSK